MTEAEIALDPLRMRQADTLPSAWAFGSYQQGQGNLRDHYRLRFAVLAIKKELTYLGSTGINLATTYFGGGTDKAVRHFQKANDLVVDGLVGPKTCNALWRERIIRYQMERSIPKDWLRAQVHWESGDDPGAEYTNPDGSRDRGLIQANSVVKPLSADQAFDPQTSLVYLADFQKRAADRFEDSHCDQNAPDEWTLAVGAWRTPVGAEDWCKEGSVAPDADGTWAQRAAYYVSRVDRDGRIGWV